MNRFAAVAAACAFASTAVLAANPFDQFKGRMKPGEYEIKMQMEMPGMPANMGKQAHTMKHCVTPEDIDKGAVGKQDQMPKDCEVKDFNMSGNTATYKTVCTGQHQMMADSKITFSDAGYNMDMKMSMNQGGQVMNMTQHMESRYLGPCSGNAKK